MWILDAIKVAEDPRSSEWLIGALAAAIKQDPTAAARDALTLVRILTNRVRETQGPPQHTSSPRAVSWFGGDIGHIACEERLSATKPETSPLAGPGATRRDAAPAKDARKPGVFSGTSDDPRY